MDMQEKIPLLAIAGPTASGKTKLAVELAKAFDGEVISADSMQVYRGMTIGTAQPTLEEMEGIPHHLIGFLDPDEAFSVAQYVELARAKIREVHNRGKLPILAGGTGLYLSSVVDNIDFHEIKSDPDLRRELEARAREEGGEALLRELASFDPELAAALHPNNLGRILRAIEVYRLTGKPMSLHQEESRQKPGNYALCYLGLCYDNRQKLYDRINLRVDLMVEAGLLQEAEDLFRSRFAGTARQAIGYKELEGYFSGGTPLEDCLEAIKLGSRRYAKRQLTWFRRDGRIHWIAVDRFPSWREVLEEAQNTLVKSGILCYTK